MEPARTVDVPAWGWAVLLGVIAVLFTVDTLAHRGRATFFRRNALGWTVWWIASALAFGLVVGLAFGSRAAEEYYGAYLTEKSLSLDNLFLFYAIFDALGLKEHHQRRALFWGIAGALVFRGIFVLGGVALVRHWEPAVFVFGALLLVAAFRLSWHRPGPKREGGWLYWFERRIPFTTEMPDAALFVRKGGKWRATRLLVAIVAVEFTDIVFAVDSVPAALAMSRDPFLVYSSNVFAVLGLRALYLVVAHAIAELRYLHYGLAAILAFAGVKITASRWLEIPPAWSVLVLLLLLGAAILASLLVQRRESRPKRV